LTRLSVIEQRPSRNSAATWVIEGGLAVSGREDDRRLDELRRGLMHHARVRFEAPDADPEAVERTLRRLHQPGYLEALDAIRSDEPIVMPELTAPGLEPDVPVCASLVRAARDGIRTSISAAGRLARGAPFAYAVSRPPGHHAGPSWFGGYCYLNTAAAAAVALLDCGASTVGILDLDLHYPNGTSAIVESIEQISLHSLHSSRGDNAPPRGAPPRTARERLVEFEEAPGASEYLESVAASTETFAGSASAIVLSLGYDTLRNDPHGCWSFSPAIFAHVGRLLASSRLPVCVVQEGGYSLGRLAACSHAFATGLLGT
jgi:acetoin utilization deacetylase AcuC-like enzyme